MFGDNLLTVVTFCIQIKQCCAGFYGPDCLPCPGPIGNPCFGGGTVSNRNLLLWLFRYIITQYVLLQHKVPCFIRYTNSGRRQGL